MASEAARLDGNHRWCRPKEGLLPGCSFSSTRREPELAGYPFDWNDAFVGALGGMGMALFLTGALFLLLGQRTRTRVA